MDGAMLQRVLIDKALEVRCQCAGHLAWAPGARAIQQALGPCLRKALPPFSERGIGHMESRGDGVDRVAGHDLTAGLRTAKDPGLVRLLPDGL